MTETQERFLRTVMSRVPVDSVVELHLFPPIRRGTLETGVAFIATELPPVVLSVVVDTVSDAPSDRQVVAGDTSAEAGTRVAEPFVLELAEDPDSPYADEPAGSLYSEQSAEPDSDLTSDESVRVPTPSPRMRILTASYRHTIKGVDRGKWTVEVQEEADAPLDAVEAVLRGVRHRCTEPADPERVSHDVLAALIAPSAVAPAA